MSESPVPIPIPDAKPKPNSFASSIISRVLDKLPKDPKIQLQYMYYLNGIILLTLIGFTISNIYSFIISWNFSYLFGAILTSVFFLMSLFGFNQTRTAYIAVKDREDAKDSAVNQVIDQITPEMIEEEMKKRNIKKVDYVG